MLIIEHSKHKTTHQVGMCVETMDQDERGDDVEKKMLFICLRMKSMRM